MKYYPQTITIDAGDSVTWTADGDAHTVTFLSGTNPPAPLDSATFTPAGGNTYSGTEFLNSGFLTPPSVPDGVHSYTITFTQPGTYTYNCLLHPGMTGTVVVQPAGSSYPSTQHNYNFQYKSSGLEDISTGLDLQNQVNEFDTSKNSDGSTNYNITAGIGNGTESIMRFLPEWVMIEEGDTVTWTNKDPMQPHTITFPGPDGIAPELPDPAAFASHGGSTFDGTQLTSSGLISPMGTPGNKTYTLKFTKAGTYNYFCIFHDDLGMKGKIIVMKKF